MKKLIFGLTMATTMLFFSGCEKENHQSATNPDSGKKPHTSTDVSKNTPGFLLGTGSRCGGSVCGAIEVGSTSKYNSIILTSTGSLVYTIYERTTAGMGFEIYTPFTQFTCGSVTYAGGLVNNGAKVMVYATFVGDPAPNPTPGAGNIVLVGTSMPGQLANSAFQTITVGNFKGQSCGGNPPG